MRSLKAITDDLAAKTKLLNPLVAKYVESTLEGEELTTFRTLKGEVETLMGEKADAERTESERQADLAFGREVQALDRHLNQPAGGAAARQTPRGHQERTESGARRTIGQEFIDSDQLKEFREFGLGRGIRSAPFRPTATLMDQRALITSTTVTDVILPQRIAGIFGPDVPILTLRAALPNGQTDSNLVEFVREASRDNNAAEVPEAGSITDNAALKPESGFTLEPDSAPVRTIATLMYVTRAALDDMSGLRSYIDGLLLRYIDERVDTQLLIGNGTPPNLEGLNVVSGTLDLDETYYTALGYGSRADRVFNAFTQIRTQSYGRAGLVILHPADLEAFMLLKTGELNQNQYVMGGPFGPQPAVPTIWGRPMIEHPDQTEGFATVLDPRAVMVMDRMDTQIYVTDSNRDLFERNIITILAETRLAFPIFQPSRIALVELGSGSDSLVVTLTGPTGPTGGTGATGPQGPQGPQGA